MTGSYFASTSGAITVSDADLAISIANYITPLQQHLATGYRDVSRQSFLNCST
jgi:hypothetical protein